MAITRGSCVCKCGAVVSCGRFLAISAESRTESFPVERNEVPRSYRAVCSDDVRSAMDNQHGMIALADRRLVSACAINVHIS